jgi:predicted amidohydrolase
VNRPIVGRLKVCYNSAFFFLRGFIARYDKQADWDETESVPNASVFTPGGFPCIFLVHGIKFGIEICFDHANGLLETKNAKVDIHVVLSAWTQSRTIVGTHFVHSSSDARGRRYSVEHKTFVDYRNLILFNVTGNR